MSTKLNLTRGLLAMAAASKFHDGNYVLTRGADPYIPTMWRDPGPQSRNTVSQKKRRKMAKRGGK